MGDDSRYVYRWEVYISILWMRMVAMYAVILPGLLVFGCYHRCLNITVGIMSTA